jgi:predicted small integral membrane protein
LRIDPQFRFALYTAFTALFITGAGWLVADQLKEGGEIWQEAAANLLMLHCGAAMLALMLLGALVPVHLRHAWRARKNRATGVVMATLNTTLIVTAFGLYYVGSDFWRPWVSRIHYGLGLALPVLLLVHVLLGRRTADNPAVASAGRPVRTEG